MDRVPTIDMGVLGVVLSDPEVIAVFPELSSTILPHAQEIRFYRGDDLDIGVQIQNDLDPPDKVAISDSVLRFAAKIGAGGVPTSLRNRVVLGNEAALIVKRSYDPEEIEIVSDTNGQVIVHVRREDTWDLPLVAASWDLEITKPVSDIALPSGSVLLSAGSDIAMSTTPSLDWTALRIRPGDLFQAQGRTVLVRAVLSAQHLQVDWSDWTAGILPTSGSPPPCSDAVCMFRGRTKTVAFGPFVPLGDVVR